MPAKLPRGLYALVDDAIRTDRTVLDLARDAIAGGVGVLQLRLETTADRPALELIRAVLAIAGNTAIIVNDRVDLVLASGAHGVHLGADDLPVDVARRLLGPDALIGATTRSLAEINRAMEQGADHVGLGPIFSTTTKHVDHPPMGLEVFGSIARASPLPVVGIAGVTLKTISDVASAGAWCAAVGSDLLRAENVSQRARELIDAFSRGSPSGGILSHR